MLAVTVFGGFVLVLIFVCEVSRCMSFGVGIFVGWTDV